MDSAVIQFFVDIEIYVYIGLGLLGLFFLWRFWRAWDELRQAAFGLEREAAQGRVNTEASFLVLLLLAALAQFAVVTFVAPSMPVGDVLPTPTLNVLASPTGTLVAGTGVLPGEELQPTPAVAGPDCTAGQINISSPAPGSTVRGIVAVTGTADIPNFGFYKFEYTPGGQENWLSVQANNTPVMDGDLGNWDTTRLTPGPYRLRLVVTDNTGAALPACTIDLNVAPPDS